MKTTGMASRQAREALDLATDPDICAVQEEEAMRAEREQIDRLIEEVDREIAAERRTAVVRLDRSFTDARRAWRAARRGERVALRSLPSQWDVADLGGEAA